jgi:hypothetical protein
MDMRKQWWIGGGLILLAASALALPFRLPLFYLNQDTHDWHIAVAHGDQRVSQTFSSHYPGLTAIVLQPTDPLPPDGQPVTLRLKDEAGRERLTMTRPMRELRDGSKLRFAFEPLDDSEGKEYLIEIETQGEVPLKLVGHSPNLYTEGELLGGGDLLFEVYYDGRLWPTLRVLLMRLAANKPGLLDQPWFYVGLSAAYTLVLLGAFVHIARSAFAAAPSSPPLDRAADHG